MDKQTKIKVLQKLALTDDDKVVPNLEKEARKIATVFENSTNYFELETAIDILNSFSFRMHDLSLTLVTALLERLKIIELSFTTENGELDSYSRKYYKKERLIINLLEVLDSIRYNHVEDVLDIYLEYSLSADEEISKKAFGCIDSLSEYNLNLYYGDEKRKGYGPFAQIAITEKLKQYNARTRLEYFAAIIRICNALLSASITGTSSTYNTVTWSTAAVSPSDDIKAIRQFTLDYLKEIYEHTENLNQKLTILGSMYSIVHTPNQGNYDDKLLDIIFENVEFVLKFYETSLDYDCMQIYQKIEHYTFWIYKHRTNTKTKPIALKIRDKINSNPEYNIYKVLIGFESIFENWEKQEDIELTLENEKEYRNKKLYEYANSINEENFESWKTRIIDYSKTDSTDLATFPYFCTFLERFGELSPKLAIKLINEAESVLSGFFPFILSGAWKSDRKLVKHQLNVWLDKHIHLQQISRFFEITGILIDTFFQEIYKYSITTSNTSLLLQNIATISRYSGELDSALREILFGSIKKLTELQNSNWVNILWYRPEKQKLLSELNEDQVNIILNSLLISNSIDYHAEMILNPIAKEYPNKMIEFFGNRIKKHDIEKLGFKYEPVPYKFQSLDKELSKHPTALMENVLSWYDGNYGLFIDSGANLVRKVFPRLDNNIEPHLINLVRSDNNKNIEIVLAILRNYEGELFLHNVCKEIVKILPDDSDYLKEIYIILDSTGVVSGEYGFANAYEEKRKNIESWLNDKNKKVQNFANNYHDRLVKIIERERERAKESIELRKHEYGD